MSIQSNINQTLSLATFLWGQSPMAKEMANKAAAEKRFTKAKKMYEYTYPGGTPEEFKTAEEVSIGEAVGREYAEAARERFMTTGGDEPGGDWAMAQQEYAIIDEAAAKYKAKAHAALRDEIRRERETPDIETLSGDTGGLI